MIRQSFCGFWVNAALHPSQVFSLRLTFSESFVSNRAPTLTLHLMIHYEMSASRRFCSRPAKTPPLILLKGSCLSSAFVLQIRGKVPELGSQCFWSLAVSHGGLKFSCASLYRCASAPFSPFHHRRVQPRVRPRVRPTRKPALTGDFGFRY